MRRCGEAFKRTGFLEGSLSLRPMPRFSFSGIVVESRGGVGEIQVFAGRKSIQDVFPHGLVRTPSLSSFAKVAQSKEDA